MSLSYQLENSIQRVAKDKIDFMISAAEAEKFAWMFNERVPGAYRGVTPHDILLMVRAELIGRYGRLYQLDLETVRKILRYELLKSLQPDPPPILGEDSSPPECQLCGQSLPTEKEGKRGRPQVYCDACIIKRANQRNREWRARKRKARRKTETKIQLR